MLKIRKNQHIYAGHIDHIQHARDFLARYGITSDDAAMRKQDDGTLYIIAKKEFELCEKK